MRAAKTKLAENEALRTGIRAITPAFATAVIFSFFLNLLLFVSPLYMLQIYDRVLGTRNLVTLGGITIIAAILLMVWAALETLRSRLLVRAGMLFDERFAAPMFRVVHRGLLRQPGAFSGQYLRDIDVIREFFTGAGLIAFCDLPWFPVYVGVAYLMHPWFAGLAIVGGIVTSVPRAAQRGHDAKDASGGIKGEYDRGKQRRGCFSKYRSRTRDGNARGHGRTVGQASSRSPGTASPGERSSWSDRRLDEVLPYVPSNGDSWIGSLFGRPT